MADVFMKRDAKALLKNKNILFLGDSNMRAQYKDLTWLLNYDTLIPRATLRSKLEESYLGDQLVERSKLHRGRDYQENRVYYDRENDTRLEFYFLTRCYNRRLQKMFNAFKSQSRLVPDVIVINSCLWDLTRWGPNGVPEYKDNMVNLMRLMTRTLPKKCLVIWFTSLPTAPRVTGGLLIKQIEFMEPMLRFEVMEANTFARDVVVKHGFDVLDNHFHTRMQMHRRAKDGVHYLPVPVRFMTNLFLTHVALTWDKPLPNNIHSVLLDKAIAMGNKPPEEPEVKMPTLGIFSKINLSSPSVSNTKGLTVTFSHEESGGRQCNVFENEFSMGSSSFEEGTEYKMRSVVQLPQNNQKTHTAAGPFRRKANKKKRWGNHPYQERSHRNPPPTNPSFYNPYPSNDPYYQEYYPYSENRHDGNDDGRYNYRY